jgi:L-ascorbate metabolism protein UlaG (beta-lactamase superfamily)
MKLVCSLLLLIALGACKHTDSTLQYLANEGVAVFHEDTTLLFDPLFRNDYGRYALVPDSTRDALFAGAPPFENITAVFVSHHHGDHFDPADMLRLLQQHTTTQLYAPQQAIDAMQAAAGPEHAPVFERTTALQLNYEDAPQRFQTGEILIEAFFVPHAGWPVRLTDVQNIAFRVTVDDEASVAHLGDADPNLIHFELHREQWHERTTDVALPPYWFFNSKMGNQILDEYVRPKHSTGIHVPSSYADPANIPKDLAGYDLFTRPGDARKWRESPE